MSVLKLLKYDLTDDVSPCKAMYGAKLEGPSSVDTYLLVDRDRDNQRNLNRKTQLGRRIIHDPLVLISIAGCFEQQWLKDIGVKGSSMSSLLLFSSQSILREMITSA